MIDIILIAWIVWGTVVGRQTHLYFLAGDIIAVGSVMIFYKTIDTINLVAFDLGVYKEKIIQLYLWLEPLQTTQLHGEAMVAIAVDIFAYFLLIGLLLAAIGVSRNIIAAFSRFQIKRTVLNASIGCLRNVLLIVMMILLIPESLLQTYWFFELSRDSLFITLIR